VKPPHATALLPLITYLWWELFGIKLVDLLQLSLESDIVVVLWRGLVGLSL
jgi:hypothetical protein